MVGAGDRVISDTGVEFILYFAIFDIGATIKNMRSRWLIRFVNFAGLKL